MKKESMEFKKFFCKMSKKNFLTFTTKPTVLTVLTENAHFPQTLENQGLQLCRNFDNYTFVTT